MTLIISSRITGILGINWIHKSSNSLKADASEIIILYNINLREKKKKLSDCNAVIELFEVIIQHLIYIRSKNDSSTMEFLWLATSLSTMVQKKTKIKLLSGEIDTKIKNVN